MELYYATKADKGNYEFTVGESGFVTWSDEEVSFVVGRSFGQALRILRDHGWKVQPAVAKNRRNS